MAKTALEWATSARRRGDHKAEKLWLDEAVRRGEVPDHSEPRPSQAAGG